MYHETHHFGKGILRFMELLFTVNIIVIDLFLIRGYLGSSTLSPVSTVTSSPTPTPSTAPVTPIVSPEIVTPPPSPETIIQQTGTKEIFVPIGQGQTTASDWTNIAGAQVSIDSSRYPAIKQIVFEASIESPNNQIVWVRLYNQTDAHPVWYSEMNMSSMSQFLTSQPIQLDSGNKLYQVQMKTQLKYPAILDLGRIHITLE